MTTPSPPPAHFTLLYFAAATSYTQRSHDFLPAPVAITELFDTLEKMYPGMKAKVLESCAVTVNLEYVDLDEERERKEKEGKALVIAEGDEVAIIPPVSSG